MECIKDNVQIYDYQIVENEFGFEYYTDYDIEIMKNAKNFL